MTIFKKIIDGEIPCDKIYEDDKFLAFLDIAPINKGHTLVIPKEEYRDIQDIPPDLFAELMKVVKKVATQLKEKLPCDAVNIGMNNGGAAGQVVFHAHVHVIPRFSNDGLRHWPGGEYEEGESKALAEKLKL